MESWSDQFSKWDGNFKDPWKSCLLGNRTCFCWKIRKEQTNVYFLVEFWKGVHLRAAIKTDSLFVESFKPQRIPLVWLCRRLYYSSPVKPPLQPPPKKRHIRVSEGVYYGGSMINVLPPFVCWANFGEPPSKVHSFSLRSTTATPLRGNSSSVACKGNRAFLWSNSLAPLVKRDWAMKEPRRPIWPRNCPKWKIYNQ